MKTIFLDRDGVINEDFGYVYRLNDFKFINGSLKALQLLTLNDFRIVIVTNQSGIARGFFKIQDFKNLTRELNKFYLNNNIKILDTFYCPHHINGVIKKFAKDCCCRKPNEGMFLKAATLYGIDLKTSIMVGDNYSDIIASNRAGIKNNFLIKNPKFISNDKVDRNLIYKIKKDLLTVTTDILT